MIRIFIVAFLIFGASSVFCQTIGDLQNLIDSLDVDHDFKEMAELASEQKSLVDLQYYELVFKNYKSSDDKTERVLAFKEIRNLQYFLYKDDLYYKAIDLYTEATKMLISEYENDIVYLQSMEVTPSVRSIVYPTLKRAIEKLGGIWDRGEIRNEWQGGVPIKGELIPEGKTSKN